MTFILRCDGYGCGKTVEAPCNSLGVPYNPPGWYSRTKDGKAVHACSHDCIPKGEMVWPV